MSHQNSTISVNTIEPQSGTTLTIGNSGQDVVVNADSIKNNVLKDAGGNALFTSNGSGVLSGVNAGFGSAQALILSQTVTDQASVSFTSGIDSTYKEYVFEFININPATSQPMFTFQVNAVGGSGFDETITSTYFYAYHAENNSAAALTYEAGRDQAQGTAYQIIAGDIGNGADENCVGELHLFNPSSTTYVKNFYSRTNVHTNAYTVDSQAAGYINTTAAIDEISFKMSSGNFDGKIKMYGIK